MKIRNYPPPPHFNTILIISCIIFILSFSASAQKDKDIISQLDTTSFKGKPLLNKSIRISNFFDPFRENQKKVNSNKEILLDLSVNYFNYLSEILEQADLNNKPLNTKLQGIIAKKGKEVSENSNIPIGIINAEALLLTKEQMEANTKAKKNNTKADSKDYETIEFIGAGLLQAEAFQGNLSFEIDPSIITNNLDNPIKGLAIDFDEGKGFEDIGWKQQTISHQFSKTGDLSIKLKLTTKRGVYITTCPFKIHFLLLPIPSYTGTVSSPKIKGGRVAANVAGAEYAIFLGCDGILDKPIIVAEGYDPNNGVNINNLVSDYRENLRVFLNNGYDLVFVNYDNGSDFIENNAQALKRVIQEINNKKVAHAEINKLSIIGLSMSGLIARWGLREMENAGQNHEVSRLICLDTPHKGANTSPGVSYVAADFANRGIASGLIEALLYNVSSYLSAIDSPAAKEQLLFQNASMAPNVYFSLFQNALSNLGNGGYPSQCKNIAFVNGALNGNPNRRQNGDLINPGDKIWDTNFEYAVCYGYIDCWTNVPNQNTEVYNEDAYGIPILCPIQFSTRSINLPYNLDRLAGGFNSSFNNVPGQQTSVSPRFAFVPTFSAVDYKGPLNTDADYTININNWLDANSQVRADRQNLTPFRAIYGNNDNNQHPFIGGEPDGIRALAINEFGLNPFLPGCQGCTTGSGGLAGTYFDNQDLTTNGNTRTQTNEVNFSSNEGNYTPFWGSVVLPPYGTFTKENISARWEGSFEAPISGTYNLNVRTDDGTRVWIDGVQRISDWDYYPPKDHNFQEFFFNAGERRNIRIEWKQGGGGYEAKFKWSFNGIESFVPACRLFPTTVIISTDCNFAVSASSFPSSVGCGGTSSLSAGCTGTGCSGVNYAWNGNGNNYGGSPAGVTLPSSNGAVSYTLTASKNGCANQTANTSVSVSGCSSGGSCNYTEGQYLTTWFGNEVISAYICGAKFFAKNNSGAFKSKSWLIGTGRFTTAETNCFEENDPRPAGCSGGGCTSPTPTISPSSSTVPSTLTASGCSGIVNWSTGASGNSISVSTAGTYTATCTNSPCTISGNGSVTVTTSGGGCSYTNGQILTVWFGNEIVRAYTCGTKFYAKNDAGYFKSKSWLTGTGRFTAAELACFEEMNPGCGGLRIASGLIENDDSLEVFPNPTNGKIKIGFTLLKDENVWFNLYDTQGKNLQLSDYEGKKGRNEVEFDLQNYSSGAYFIDLQYGQKREVRKVVKVN